MRVLPQAPHPRPRTEAPPRKEAPAPKPPARSAAATACRVHLEVHEVPLADPLVLWDALPEAPAAYWRAAGNPGAGEHFTGVGEALSLTATGEGRFAQVASEARELLAGLELPFPGALRLVGGLAFDPEGGSSTLWQDFGAARFVLPRFTYLPGLPDTRSARLVVVRLAGEGGEVAARITEETSRVREALERNAPVSPQGLWPARIERLSRETWSEWIGRVQAAIGSGVVSKVVLARESVLDLPVPLSGRAILSRLAAEHQDCFCYGIRSGEACFVGASPERLLRLDGRRVQVDALAGTAGVPERGASSSALERAAEELRSSLKDRSEHDYVVDAIKEALTPLCPLLEVAEVPTIRQLRHVLHLHTPIEGLLSRPAHLLEVAAALHPTPAVAGTPTAEARAILGACEGRDRGWYAGPIGWFDTEGSGELCVGLRSGLLRGRQAHLFAGAGVVSGSRADAEYEETRLKERALCQALGVAP